MTNSPHNSINTAGRHLNQEQSSDQVQLSNREDTSFPAPSSIQGTNKTLPSLDLNHLAQGFIAIKQDRLSRELAEKYGVPLNEVDGVVDSFLKDTYGPAIRLAKAIHNKKRAVLLFIGKKDCPICQKSRPVLESFLLSHLDLEGVLLDYSQPEGLLYHVIYREEKGMLPLIAIIFQGTVRMVSCGECIGTAVYEKYYSELHAVCSQNIYVH